jgi:hypothetical protein
VDKNQASPFNFNFKESSSDETTVVKTKVALSTLTSRNHPPMISNNSAIYSNVRAHRRNRTFSSASSSSRLDDSSGVTNGYKDRTKWR